MGGYLRGKQESLRDGLCGVSNSRGGLFLKYSHYSSMTLFENNFFRRCFQDDKKLHVWLDSGTGLTSHAIELANAVFDGGLIIHPVYKKKTKMIMIMTWFGIYNWKNCLAFSTLP